MRRLTTVLAWTWFLIPSSLTKEEYSLICNEACVCVYLHIMNRKKERKKNRWAYMFWRWWGWPYSGSEAAAEEEEEGRRQSSKLQLRFIFIVSGEVIIQIGLWKWRFEGRIETKESYIYRLNFRKGLESQTRETFFD